MYTVFYVHLRTLFKIVYYNILFRFSWKRALTTLVFLFIYILFSVIIFLARLLDELLFPNYRKIKIEKPLFIISNPRSGTTFLHRLLCLDEDKWVYTKLYETIFPSILIYKIVDFISLIDSKVGNPVGRSLKYLDSKIFGGWTDIHPMGFDQSEEDEGFYVFSTVSAGIFLLIPYLEEFPHLRFPDDLNSKHLRKYMLNYKNSLKRLMYAKGSSAIYLSKNVLSTGRLRSIIEYFPDAKIVYLIRHPYKSVPSLTSMFKAAWDFHSPEIPDNSKTTRQLGQLVIDFYNYFNRLSSEIPQDQIVTIRYEDLTADPVAVVELIYDHFGYNISEKFRKSLKQNSERSKSYKSSHMYSLGKFGFSEEYVYNQLKEVFDRFHFER